MPFVFSKLPNSQHQNYFCLHLSFLFSGKIRRKVIEILKKVEKEQRRLREDSERITVIWTKGLEQYFDDDYKSAAQTFRMALIKGGTNNKIKRRPSEHLILLMVIEALEMAGDVSENSRLEFFKNRLEQLLEVDKYLKLEEMIS